MCAATRQIYFNPNQNAQGNLDQHLWSSEESISGYRIWEASFLNLLWFNWICITYDCNWSSPPKRYHWIGHPYISYIFKLYSNCREEVKLKASSGTGGLWPKVLRRFQVCILIWALVRPFTRITKHIVIIESCFRRQTSQRKSVTGSKERTVQTRWDKKTGQHVRVYRDRIGWSPPCMVVSVSHNIITVIHNNLLKTAARIECYAIRTPFHTTE